MTTTQISYTQGMTRSAVSISCAAGEELSIVLSLFNANGTARDCSGGTVSFSFERPSRTGTPLKSSVSGQVSGVHTITLLAATTRFLDGQYTWDAWYHPASGAPEKLVYNGTWTVTPSVGSGGDESVDSLIQTELDDIQSGAIRVYGTCAAVRADTTASTDNPTVYVIGRGTFHWTTSAGTDTNTELTSYIAGSGGGFAFESSAFRDYTDVTTLPAYKAGRVFYNDNSLNLMTDFSDVTIQIGEETQSPVYNGESVQINNGQIVYSYGPQGQRLDVRKLASGSGNSMRMVGLATHDISSHQNGRITVFGLVRGVNTQALAAGAQIYTSGTAGVPSTTIPTGDQDGVRAGFVMNSHPTDGAYMVLPLPVPRLASTTANLPSTARIGESYLNMTLDRPQWRNTANAAWIDATNGLALPTAYAEKSTPSGTTSATLVDVPGTSLTITLVNQQYVTVQCSFEIQTQSGASASVIGVALIFDSTTEAEYQRELSGTTDRGIGGIVARTALLAAGTHTIKLQYRRVSGVSTPGINKADLLATGTMLQ